MKFELKGVDEAVRSVSKIAEQITDRFLKEDAFNVLEGVAADARSLAPVDQGSLRDSIQVVEQDGFVAVVIGDWKGHFYEFGTVNHRAQPMLIPAWEANEDLVVEMFGKRVGARIEGA